MEQRTSTEEQATACTHDERYSRNRELIYLAQQGDEGATETLIVENTALVKSIALKFRDRGTEFEDLMQIGTIGMIKAIRSFDIERGTAFSTYAVPLIVGEIRRHLRDDGLIRVSRGYKRTGITIMREKNRIMTEEGREAGVAELAAFAGVSVEEAAISIDAVSPVASLSDNVYGEDSKTLDATIPDRESADELENLNDRIALGQAIAKMPPDWRKIVLLRYYRNMTQQQVANLMGLSQVKVSREEKKIMTFLRGEMA
ncbi:MAG: sigma-70 family RNA polymerase sigma factor [Clostridia bacterium]|nr:sigma-70 family RNA polymerase sigma factor [Clostridia bacterium]